MRPNRDPFDPFDELRKILESMQGMPAGSINGGQPYVDQSVDQGSDILSITVDLSGIEQENIDASIEQGNNGRQALVIETQNDTDGLQRKSEHMVMLKERVDAELADASYNNGVLTIEIPIVDPSNTGTDIDI